MSKCDRLLGEEITSSSFAIKDHYNILIEYCGGGSLAERMKKANSSCGLSELEVVSIARDMVRGLAEIHGRGYVYCDIKPSNILLLMQVMVVVILQRLRILGCRRRRRRLALPMRSMG